MPDNQTFALSSAPTIEIERIGAEQQPVIVIDGAMHDPRALIRFAVEQARFEAVRDNLFPGVRAAIPLAYAGNVARTLDPLLRGVFGLERVTLVRAECFYSIVTTPPGELQPFQRIPHIDTTNMLQFAVVHFLCAEGFGGTGFYRQKATGFETISADRERRWAEERDSALERRLWDARYIADDDPDYERIALFPARFDRLIAYRSNALHSGHIPVGMPLVPDPTHGRLTTTLFIGYRPD